MASHTAASMLADTYTQILDGHPRISAKPVDQATIFARFITNEAPSRKAANQARPVKVKSTTAAPAAPKAAPKPPAKPPEQATATEAATEAQGSWFQKLKRGLSKTQTQLGTQLNKLFSSHAVDEQFTDTLETLLITADVGIHATNRIVEKVSSQAKAMPKIERNAVMDILKQELTTMLEPVAKPITITPTHPFVILVVGVNGVGKTTTIGKLAKYYQSQGLSVALAAGDTFRAAAVEQLQVWGERNNVPVIAQHTGADSASVIFDAVQSAQSKQIDVVIADTAGRLHNKSNLMTELAKVKRVMQKLDSTAPHETLLVLDAGTGQNALSQAKEFNDAVELSGIALTKLDGTAKGGIIFALSENLGLPVRFIGVGEGIDDLRPFAAKDFVEAMLSN